MDEILSLTDDSGNRITMVLVNGLKNGALKIENSGGQCIYKAQYVDDELDGPSECLDDQGHLIMTMHYKKGKRDGPFINYFENGNKMIEGAYNDDLLEGEVIYFDEYGDIMQKRNYAKGLLHGQSISFYPQAKGECLIENYDHGDLHGMRYSFYPTGELLEESEYERGVPVVYPTQFNKNGVAINQS